MLTVLSSFAQEESKNVSDNLKWRARKTFEQGELMINPFAGSVICGHCTVAVHLVGRFGILLMKAIYENYRKCRASRRF